MYLWNDDVIQSKSTCTEGGLYQPGMVPRVPSGRDFNLPPWDPEALPSDVILPPEFTQDELDMLLEVKLNQNEHRSKAS
jgi:hypothetical protein